MRSENVKLPVVIVGPTAVGKTEAALVLAHKYDGEIINADSMQVYRGMNIGTAKPDKNKLNGVPYHLLDIVDPDTVFNAAEWKMRATECLQHILSRDKQPIICGGTGLYIRALLDNWSLAATPANRQIRCELESEAQAIGLQALHTRLKQVDQVTASRLNPNDKMRIIRALEVYAVTGEAFSKFIENDKAKEPSIKAIRIGLSMERGALYNRINERVDQMIALGFLAEVIALRKCGYNSSHPPMRSLGYKEMGAYLDGDLSQDEAVELTKKRTRHYAKRQQTWFRADSQINWLDVTRLNLTQITETAERIINTSC